LTELISSNFNTKIWFEKTSWLYFSIWCRIDVYIIFRWM